MQHKDIGEDYYTELDKKKKENYEIYLFILEKMLVKTKKFLLSKLIPAITKMGFSKKSDHLIKRLIAESNYADEFFPRPADTRFSRNLDPKYKESVKEILKIGKNPPALFRKCVELQNEFLSVFKEDFNLENFKTKYALTQESSFFDTAFYLCVLKQAEGSTYLSYNEMIRDVPEISVSEYHSYVNGFSTALKKDKGFFKIFFTDDNEPRGSWKKVQLDKFFCSSDGITPNWKIIFATMEFMKIFHEKDFYNKPIGLFNECVMLLKKQELKPKVRKVTLIVDEVIAEGRVGEEENMEVTPALDPNFFSEETTFISDINDEEQTISTSDFSIFSLKHILPEDLDELTHPSKKIKTNDIGTGLR